MTPQEIITEARDTLNDTDPVSYRNSNSELLRYVNAAINECSMLAPQLFYTTGDMQCEVGRTEQAVSFSDAQALADVIRVKGGRYVPLGDVAALSAFNPNWGQDAPGEAVNWYRHIDDTRRFYIHPAAPAAQVLEVKYVRNPTKVALNEEIVELPSSMQPALVSYVIARAESKDDEHVNSGRANAELAHFISILKP